MAQWTQTLEPYIKVYERIKTVAQNPTAGESLIIGCALISDAGPSTPTLITSQSEFLATYASQDLSQAYIESLNQLYSGADKTTAATMWANAYRLAGSNSILVVRASKADDIYFAKPLVNDDVNKQATYILRDGELLKSVSEFKMVLDIDADDANHNQDGWNININGVGVFGNRTTDEGAQYDYFVQNLPDLVEQLNETSKFFSPAFKFYKDNAATEEIEISSNSSLAEKNSVRSVIFEEVYLGSNIIDTTDPRTLDNYVDENKDTRECPETVCPGMAYVITCEIDWTAENPDQKVIDLNSYAWSGFIEDPWYATNVFNSATTLKVRIRRFNHDAVVSKTITDTASLEPTTNSPYVVLESVLDTFTEKGKKEPNDSILERDFYEVAVWDPSVNNEVSFFNIGNIPGRGDIEVSELNSLLKMVQLNLPDNMRDLGLNYYDYKMDDKGWEKCDTPLDPEKIIKWFESEKDLFDSPQPPMNTIYAVGSEATQVASQCYIFTAKGNHQIFADLTIDPVQYKFLSVSDSDLKKALDQIALDEVYVTEGLCDLGNTELSFQSYMANMAINDNYFYPISTINSTNYMTIGNGATKISQDSPKLYMSAPWDIDSSTLGWKYYASPSVLYWEAVAARRRNNREFSSFLGQVNGVVQYQRPVTEFNKKSRQLLLSKKVNTVKWNISTQAWNMNDCYTKQNEDNVMSEDGNSRLMIRISKAIPTLTRQFIGKKISEKLCAQVEDVINYFFKTVIIPMEYTVDSYLVTCKFDEALARKNKIKIHIQARYARSLKFIDVFNDALELGVAFEEE